MRTEYRLLHKPERNRAYEQVSLHPTREAAAEATNVADLSVWLIGGNPEVRYVDTPDAMWLIIPERIPESDPDRITLALDVALSYGQTDGAHHKSWTIDQMVRALAGDRYEQVIAEYEDGEDGPRTYTWDEGIAP